MIPKAITPELICTSPDLFRDFSHYIMEMRPPGHHASSAQFPIGLQRLQKIVELDLAVHNGGLWGYLGDLTNDDGSVDDVDECISILRQMNAAEVADILDEAMQVWRDFLAAYLPVRDRVNKKPFEEFQSGRSMRDEMEQQLDPLDDAYYESHASMSASIGGYIREHPHEFLHPVAK